MSDWVPVLRAACDPPQAFAAALEDASRGLVRRPVGPGVHALLAEDQGMALRFVTRGELDGSAEGAWVAALGALAPTAGLEALGDGIFQVQDRDGLAASRLLLPGFLSAFTDSVGGPPVVAVPHARAIWVASEAQAPALLERAIAAWQREGTPISPLLYQQREGRLEVWGGSLARVQWAWAALRHRLYRRTGESLGALFSSPRFAPTRLLEREGRWGVVSTVRPDLLPVLVPACEWLVLQRQQGPALLDLPALAEAEGWQRWPGLDPPWWGMPRWPVSMA